LLPLAAKDRAAEILQNLVEEFPDNPDYRYDLAETYAMVDVPSPFSAGPPDAAAEAQSREMLDKALAISAELVAAHPNIPDYAVSQVFIQMRLAALLRKGDPSGAEHRFREALELQSALVRRFPRISSYRFWAAVIHETLARLCEEQGRMPEARSELERSIALFEEVLQIDTRAWPVRGILALHYEHLASLLSRLGDDPAAAEARVHAQQLRPGR
jgi:tetratricopeptide (TPR) repeat protein